MALSSRNEFAIRSQAERSFRLGRATVNHNSAMNSFRPAVQIQKSVYEDLQIKGKHNSQFINGKSPNFNIEQNDFDSIDNKSIDEIMNQEIGDQEEINKMAKSATGVSGFKTSQRLPAIQQKSKVQSN